MCAQHRLGFEAGEVAEFYGEVTDLGFLAAGAGL